MTASSTSSPEPRTALVTGASSGIGREIAKLLAGKGFRVLGTCRKPENADPLPGVRFLPLDLTDPESVRACAEAAGPVDVLVNNAGRSQLGPFEDTDPGVLEGLFELNLFGPARLTRLCLPGMRARGGGTIVMIGSLISEFPVGFHSAYVSSKIALRGLSLALRQEVAPFGIRVSVVQPAYFRSNISRGREIISRPGSAYEPWFAALRGAVDAQHGSAGDSRVVAEHVWRIVTDRNPPAVRSVGGHAGTYLALRRLLPSRLVERVLVRRYHLSTPIEGDSR